MWSSKIHTAWDTLVRVDGFSSFHIAQYERRLLLDSGLLQGLPAGARILHVECGLGDNAATLARLLPTAEILGVDRSKQAIAQARHRHPRVVYPNMAFAHAGSMPKLLSDRPVDLITSNSPLTTADQFKDTVGSMVDYLKVGGKVWLTSPSVGSAERIANGLRGLALQPEWAQHFQSLGKPAALAAPTEVRTWLRDAGLQKCFVSVTDQHLCFPGLNAFTNWLSCKWSAYFLRLPTNQHRPFLDTLVNLAIPRRTGRYCVDFAWLSARAVVSARD